MPVLDCDPAKAASDAAEHGVRFEDAMAVFRDPLALPLFDAASRHGGERWITLGLDPSGTLRLVVHSWIEGGGDRVTVRITSARRPTRDEARHHREGA